HEARPAETRDRQTRQGGERMNRDADDDRWRLHCRQSTNACQHAESHHVDDAAPVVSPVWERAHPHKPHAFTLLGLEQVPPARDLIVSKTIVAEARSENTDAVPAARQFARQIERSGRHSARRLGVVIEYPDGHVGERTILHTETTGDYGESPGGALRARS